MVSYGLRIDGRRPLELRTISCQIGVMDSADGSSLFQIGNTAVLAFVRGPKQSRYDRGKLSISAFFVQSGSTSVDGKRSSGKDKRSIEFEANLKSMFDSVIVHESLEHSEIEIHAQVLQDDGSTESAAVNAITLALIHAGVPLRDLLVSCSSGAFNGTSLVDLNYFEAQSFAVVSEFRVAIASRTEKLAYCNYDDIGGHKLTPELVQEMVACAVMGCKHVQTVIRDFLLRFYTGG